MNNHLQPLLAVLLVVATCSAASGCNYGCMGPGGGGPTPLLDLTTRIKVKVDVVPTEGGVREFLLPPGENEVVYRNPDDIVYSTRLRDGSSKALFKASSPLSRVTDPHGRFFLAEGVSWLFDALLMRWVRLLFPKSKPEPLFWHEKGLFSLKRGRGRGDTRTFRIYRYEAGDVATHQTCPTLELPAGTELAEGRIYPQLLFYREQPAPMGSILQRTLVNVETCEVSELGASSYVIPGKAVSVHWFSSSGALAVQVDHPTHRLLWDSHGSCEYFDTGNARMLVPNDKRPLLAAWSSSGELSLVDPAAHVRARLLVSDPSREVDSRSIYQTDDGTTVYIAPHSKKSFPLIRMSLAGFAD